MAGQVVYFEGSGLGDGLPLVCPGDAAIAAMLEGKEPDIAAVSGPVPISFVVPTWWELAVCAVLAGCRPGGLALVAAAVDAMVDPAFNLLGVQATTGAAAPLLVLAGSTLAPLRLNASANALGPGNRANATLGRAVRLVLQGVGLCEPGAGDMATHGHPGKYTWLVVENRADSPWPSLSEPASVTVFAGVGNVEVVLPASSAERVADRIAEVISALGAANNVLLLPPESATFLNRNGWNLPQLTAELASRQAAPALVVVTGGAGTKATIVPGWGGGSHAVTRQFTLREHP